MLLYIFILITDFLIILLELRKLYKNTKDIEMFVNSWSLQSLVKECDVINSSDDYIEEFAKAIQYFWQLRVNSLFPSRDIVVEIGEEIMGEEGLTVTLYQKGQPK